MNCTETTSIALFNLVLLRSDTTTGGMNTVSANKDRFSYYF